MKAEARRLYRDLLRALRQQTAAGANVIAVLHQPSFPLYCQIDDVLLLARTGFAVDGNVLREFSLRLLVGVALALACHLVDGRVKAKFRRAELGERS